jgi:thiol-disulfide isomerase/thioredoxin
MSKSLSTAALAVLVFGLSVAAAVVVRRAWQPATDSGRGRLLFAAHCATCHGTDGHGDGPAAAGLAKPPTDFAAGWKHAVDAESMRRVIVRGISGTAMPAAPTLAPTDLESLISFVQSLGNNKEDSIASHLRKAGFVPELPPRQAPDLDLRAVNGSKPVTLADFSGKLMLVSFWATDCAPCLAELPHLERLAKQYPEKLAVVAVRVSDEPTLAVETVGGGNTKVSTHMFDDPKGLSRLRYQVQALPTNVLIDSKGRILGRLVGPIDADRPEIQRLIEACTSIEDRR